MEEEVWKDIKGWEGLYQISSTGRVKSFARKIVASNNNTYIKEGRILIPSLSNGYFYVTLKNKNMRNVRALHELVASNFIGDRLPKYCINHKDGNKKNNNLVNLEIVTKSEDIKHAYRTKLRIPSRSMLGRTGENNPFIKPIIQLDKENNIVNRYISLKQASDLTKIPKSTLSLAVTGRIKISHGYIWKYAYNEQIKEAV